MRDLVSGALGIQDHVIHFYQLQAMDWVDVMSALKADPKETAAIAKSLSDWPLSSATYFAGVQKKLKDSIAHGQYSIFTNGYWGHPAYKLPGRGALSPGPGLAAGHDQDPHHPRRQEPAPELPGGRHGLRHQHEQ